MRASWRGAGQRWARRVWDGRAGPVGAAVGLLLTPLALAYRAGVAWKNRRADRSGGPSVDGVRVVSIGNLSVGGTGKTPVAAWAVGLLTAAGRSVALVSRGYGRDELLLHRRWHPDVPVVADPDRVAAVRRARDGGADAVVLDDGFQHRRLARDVDEVLLAAEDPLPARLLPRGPYREPPSALARADAVVVTRRTASVGRAEQMAAWARRFHPSAVVARAVLEPGGWHDLQGRASLAPDGPTLVATSVARPGPVAAHVGRAGGQPTGLLAYPDHHEFTEADARRIRRDAGARPVSVTEKDAVKLAPFASILGDVRVLTQTLRWESGGDAVADLIRGTERP